MTSLKSFDKSFKTMFINKLKSGIFFPAIGALVLFIITVAEPFGNIVMLNGNVTVQYAPFNGLIQLDNVRYILIEGFNDETCISYMVVLMYVAVIIAAILCAICTFQQLSSKRTANIYYSLGFSRTGLFASTYCAGAACVLGMVIIPFFLSFVINAFSFGISKELLTAVFYVSGVLMNVSLIAYTVAAIAMIMSSMLIEGAFFAFFFNGISAIFTFASCLFSDALLTGSAFATNTNMYYSLGKTIDATFTGSLSFLNSLSHSVGEISKLESCLITNDIGGLEDHLSSDTWQNPNWIPLICWTVILAGLVYLANYIFNRKKNENIGFFASNRASYRIFFGACVLGFTPLACSQGKDITKGLSWLYILIVLAITLLISFIFTLILSKIAKFRMKGERKYFALYAGITLLMALVFSSGFFGYVNRIPKAENIVSIQTTKIINESTYDNFDFYCAGDDYGECAPITMKTDYGSDWTRSFDSSSNEIEKVRELHKALIEADKIKNNSDKFDDTRISYKFQISYTLKNGKKVERIYSSLSPAIIEKYIQLDTVSKDIKDDLKRLAEDFLLTSEQYSYDVPYDTPEYFYTVFSNDLTNAHNVELTSKQLSDFVIAYQADIDKMSILDIYNPTSKPLGVIAIREDQNLYRYIEGEGDVFMGKLSEVRYKTLINTISKIFITDDMANTVRWARENGIYKYFESNAKTDIVKLEATYNNTTPFRRSLSNSSNCSAVFNGRSALSEGSDYYFDYNIYGSLTGSHEVYSLNDKEMTYIRQNLYTNYLITETGHFIQLTTADGYAIQGFIPDSRLTPELKIKLSVVDELSEESEYESTTGKDTTHSVIVTEYYEGPAA